MPASNESNLAQTVASISTSLRHIEDSLNGLKQKFEEHTKEVRELRESLIEVRTKQNVSRSVWAYVMSAVISVGVSLVVSRLFSH